MTDIKPKPYLYYILAFILVSLGLGFAIILSYDYLTFSAGKNIVADALCKKGSYFDCSQVSGSEAPYSKLFGIIPVSLLGIGFYLMVALYFLFPSMNPKSENYLKIPAFFLLIIGSIIDLVLMYISFVLVGKSCPPCMITWASTFALLFLVYWYDIREKGLLQEMKDYFNSLFRDDFYQKEIVMYAVFSLLLLSLIFFLNQNKVLFKEAGKDKTKVAGLKKQVRDLKAIKAKKGKEIEKIIAKVVPISTLKGFQEMTNLPFLGTDKSPIQFHIFHDPQCGHCQTSYFDFIKLEKEYHPLIKVNFIDYPYGPSGKLSQLTSFQLSQFALVAHQEGKYVDFVKILFTKLKAKEYINKSKIQEIFKSVNITTPFNELEKRAAQTKSQLDKQNKFGEKLKVETTPGIFLNGRYIGGHKHKLIITLLRKEILKYAKNSLESSQSTASKTDQ